MKRTIIILFSCSSILFPLTVSAARTGDCSPNNSPNSCWQFSSGQKIMLKERGAPISATNSNKKWSYEISNPNGSSTTLYMGLEAQLGFASTPKKVMATNNGRPLMTTIHPSYNSEHVASTSNTQMGRYDCLRSYLSLPLPPNTTSISVETPAESSTTIMPVALCDGNSSEKGLIMGPKGKESTALFIDQTDDGHGFAMEKTRHGNMVNVYRCPAAGMQIIDMTTHCNPMNFATNYEPVEMLEPAQDEIFLSFSPRNMPTGKFKANGAINSGGQTMRVHTGTLEYVSEGAVLQFSNSGTCFKINGVLRCY